MKAAALSLATALALTLAACSAPPVQVEEPSTSGPAPTRQRAQPTFDSEVGALDPTQVQAVFDSASESLKECYSRGVGRIGFLAGEIKLAVRVLQDGSTKYAFVKESTLGDRSTEECMLGVVKRKTWPKPQGGREGTAETSFTFDP